MKISENCIRFIMAWEDFSPNAYKDGENKAGNQLYSIGYGHQIKSGEGYLLTTTISKQEAISLLKKDIEERELRLSKAIKIQLTQYEFDAIFSWYYATGNLKSDLIKMINNKSPYGQVRKFWTTTYITSGRVFYKGILRRRVMEADVFANGWNEEILKGRNSELYRKINSIDDVPIQATNNFQANTAQKEQSIQKEEKKGYIGIGVSAIGLYLIFKNIW